MQPPNRSLQTLPADLQLVSSLLNYNISRLMLNVEQLNAKLPRIARGLQFLREDTTNHPDDDERRRRNCRASELLHAQITETEAGIAQAHEDCCRLEALVDVYQVLVTHT